MRQVSGEIYLDLAEVAERYNWGSSTLYHFRSLKLVEAYRFVGDRKSYWKVSELEAIRNRPPEASKRGPKSSGGRISPEPPLLTTSALASTVGALAF